MASTQRDWIWLCGCSNRAFRLAALCCRCPPHVIFKEVDAAVDLRTIRLAALAQALEVHFLASDRHRAKVSPQRVFGCHPPVNHISERRARAPPPAVRCAHLMAHVQDYADMRDLLNALLGTDCFSASHAPPESKNGKLRTMLQKIAESSEFEYLECVDYRDMAPKQLEDLYCSVFLAIDDTDEPLFKAARRKIDHYAFGTCAHPTYARRSSPRLSALAQGSQGSKRRFSDG